MGLFEDHLGPQECGFLLVFLEINKLEGTLKKRHTQKYYIYCLWLICCNSKGQFCSLWGGEGRICKDDGLVLVLTCSVAARIYQINYLRNLVHLLALSLDTIDR